jgi:serine/threonine-protein kinase
LNSALEPHLTDDSSHEPRREFEPFGPYRVVEKIAGGGMAEIFKVFHESRPDKFFALKRIRSDRSDDPDFRKMLVDEAKIASRLKHRNIAGVLSLQEANGTLGLLLEYVDGIDLIRAMRVLRERNARFPTDVAIHILRETLEGLEFAHGVKDERGEPLHVVHRDVSPGNVMIDLEGQVRIVDWGIARAKNRIANTETGHVKGKFRYMAPEQITGNPAGPHTDVYAAAITFWEVLANRRIYDDIELPQMMMRVANADVPSLDEARSGLPRQVHAVFKKATAKEPARRYPTARAFIDALKELPVTIDPDNCRLRMRKIPLQARLQDETKTYERAVMRAKTAAERDLGDLEDALLRALESPDRVERVSIDRERLSDAEQLRRTANS